MTDATPPVALRAATDPRRRGSTRLQATPAHPAALFVVVPILATTLLVVLGPPALVVTGREEIGSWLARSITAEHLVATIGVQALGNLVLFVPLAAATAWCTPRRHLTAVMSAVVVLPLLVEVMQAFLPGRVPDGMDVLRNTAGVVAAAVVTLAIRVALQTAAARARGWREGRR